MKLISANKALVSILIISLGLRLILVLQGGQEFWPDEYRYVNSFPFLDSWVHGNYFKSLVFLSSTACHPAFVVISGCIQYAYYLIFKLLPAPSVPVLDKDFISTDLSLKFAAFCLGTFSVISIFLVYKIAKRTGAGKRERLIAAFLMACSNGMFYYSRHIFPYDMAMAFALLGIWIGLKKGSGIGRSFVCGTAANFAFMLYYGVFAIALSAMVLNVLIDRPKTLKCIFKALANMIGFLAIPAALTTFSAWAGKQNFALGMENFIGTITQGDFAEGWALPWGYLWHTEHLLLFIWIIAIFIIIKNRFFLKDRSDLTARAVMWLSILCCIYISMGFSSAVLNKFVIYGRAVRQMLPFFCLLSASSFEMSARAQRPNTQMFLLALIVIQAAVNFKTPLFQKFPDQVQEYISRKYGQVGHDITIIGPSLSFHDNINPFVQYVLLNAQNKFSPLLGAFQPVSGEIIYRTHHPYEFIPYQYEGFTPQERTILQSNDMSIRLVKIKNALLENQ